MFCMKCKINGEENHVRRILLLEGFNSQVSIDDFKREQPDIPVNDYDILLCLNCLSSLIKAAKEHRDKGIEAGKKMPEIKVYVKKSIDPKYW